MLKSERRSYRKSPGRQYGYDYDPLRSKQTTSNLSGRSDDSHGGERWPSNSRGETTHPTTGVLSPRPDPRRTRQLLRQNILASKARATVVLAPEELEHETDYAREQRPYGHETQQRQSEELEDSTLYRNRYAARQNYRHNSTPKTTNQTLHPYIPVSPSSPTPAPAPAPRPQRVSEQEQVSEQEFVEWEPQDIDPDLGYEYEDEDPLDHRVGYSPVPTRRPLPTRTGRRDNAADDYDEEEELEQPRRKKRKGVTRRSLLWGLGLAAVGGGAVAAIELGPKLPQALQSASSNIEHQLQAEFNKGVAAGAEQVRKEFLTALDSVEGVSLDAAIEAAKLTRTAYDVFVSPLVTLAATVTGDFLSITLRAVQTARSWLGRIYQDNATLNALQIVLQTWVNQVNSMPKHIQTITDTDLDGAQAYLRGLQHTLQQEQAKLNQQQQTPVPSATPKAKPTSTPKP